MLRAFLAALALLLAGLGSGIAAAAGTPEEFLHSIYDSYGTDSSGGVMLDSPEAIGRYFTPEFAAIINADDAAADARGEVPLLDGDPFISAQDWDVAGMQIAVTDQEGERATGTASFTNFGEPQTVTLDLVLTADGWRIDDIVWPDGYGMREMYRENAGAE